MAYLIGIDVGTSSAKTVLINEKGEVVFTTAPEYSFATPKPLWAESNPEDWWQATIVACQTLLKETKIDPSEIAGIGLTGQMHGLVMLDKEGDVLRPCIMWNDQRTAEECAEITATVGAERVLELTGNPVLPGFTAPKVLWVRKHEPDVYQKCEKILLPKDYIRYRMSGAFFTDVSDASGMSLLDVARRTWSDEMLKACDIPRSWLPEVTESTVASTTLSESAAEVLGLVAGTPIIAGGGDQAAQAVGCGIVKEGVVSATLGTSGVVFAHSDQYRVEPEGRLHAFCAAVPGKWHLMGVMLSAAGSFQWYKNQLGGEEIAAENATGRDAYEALTATAAGTPSGAEGLLFLPYLSGERTPHPDPLARGVFFGLSLRHTKAHMTRAVLEGVSYGLNDSLQLMADLGIQPSEVVASGGGAKSKLWKQILANIFDTKITTNNASEGAAYGAAILAGVGANVFESVEAACEQTLTTTSEVSPNSDVEVYRDYYEHYRALYPLLKSQFSSLAKTVDKHL